MEADGFYFDDSGALAAFDTELTQGINSVVVRKDIIDAFLNETGMKLVWLGDADKDIYTCDTISSWSKWEAALLYEGNSVSGTYQRMKSNSNLKTEDGSTAQATVEPPNEVY